MFALDLFNNDHERRLAEGAVDQLEQRRIDDLAMKMDNLAQRARATKDPIHKAALAREFQKAKDERDSYYMVRNETMGYGGLVGEEDIPVQRPSGSPWAHVKGGAPNKGLPDIANKAEKMARATPPTPASKVASTVKNAAKWLAGKGGPGKEGPTYESQKKNSEAVAEQDVAEGWSDAIVARRTGQPRTPYAVYIKGKKWKDFENDDLARAVMDKLKAKFRADGRDPETITIAPTDMSESVAETALNPLDPKNDYEAKRRALHDLSLNKDVDQAAVLQRRLDLDREAKTKGITEGAMSNLHADLADVYRRMAPGIERNRDSFKAGQLYDALEAVAEQHGAEAEFKRMMSGARNRAHMDYDTNPGGFQNWFWYLPFDDEEELAEEQDTNGVEQAIIRRIMVAHTDLLMKFGPEKVMQAAEEVAYNVGDVDEIGTSDVSAYINQVRQILGA